MKRLLGVLGFAVCGLAVPAGASATSITFIFDCTFLSTTTSTCTPGGPFGTLTLSDSVVDPNRVDISWHLEPAYGATLERMLLNFTGSPSPSGANAPFLVAANAPVGSQTSVGFIQFASNAHTMDSHFAFDIRVSPNDNDFDFSGSIAVFNTNLNPDQELNIDLSNFYPVFDSGDGTPGLYAGYKLNNVSNLGEFWAGSSSTQNTSTQLGVAAVPEPATWTLLGVGLAGLALRRRLGSKRS